MFHWKRIRVAEERGWMTSLGEIIFPAWLLSSLLFTGHQYERKRSPHFLPLSEVYLYNFFPDLLICILLVLFYFVRRQTISFLLDTSLFIQDRWLTLLQKGFLLLLSIMPLRPGGSSSFPVSANILYWHIWESDQIPFFFCQSVIGSFSYHNDVISIVWGKEGR